MCPVTHGYQVINLIQSAQAPFLDCIALGASFLGHEAFFTIFVPVYYWCVDKRQGVRLALVFLASAYLNGLVKEAFKVPRPDPALVRVLWPSSGTGYSVPSGHAQNAIIFGGWLGRRMPWRRIPGALVLVVLAISLSRMYLGLHFPEDILGGWALGGGLLGAMVFIDRRISREPKGWEGKVLPWFGVVLSLFMFLFSTARFHPMVSGAMLGFTLGYLVESRWVGFSPQGSLRLQAAKLALGGALGVVLEALLRFSLPRTPEGHFVHYSLMGLWVSLGLPLLCHSLWGEKEGSRLDP
jgi:membrane-associated phospholipid phosphatase